MIKIPVKTSRATSLKESLTEDPSQLNSFGKTTQSSKKYECQKCVKTFTCRSGLLNHVKKSCEESEFKLNKPPGILCNLCPSPNAFLNKRLLFSHKLKSHPDVNLKAHICSICNTHFARKSSLGYHVRQLHNQSNESFFCKFCKKSFRNKNALARHENIHIHPDRFKCQFCTKGFSRSDTLQVHLTTHTNQKLYECGMCQVSYTTTGSLRKHMVKHTGEKQYKCKWPGSDCTAEFTSKACLKTHEKNSHWGEDFPKPFACKVCDYKTSENGDLTKHINRVHFSGELKFECLNCSRKFKNEDYLRRHMQLHTTPKRFSCYFCHLKFRRSYHLDGHIVTHTKEKPFICEVEGCRKSYGHLWSIKSHIKTHENEKLFKCEYCRHAYHVLGTLKDHVRRCHTGVMPFKCEECNAPFKTSFQRILHFKREHSHPETS